MIDNETLQVLAYMKLSRKEKDLLKQRRFQELYPIPF